MHGLYREKYAYREYMTDVVVQNMDSDVQMRIKCRAYVKRIAVYNNRLAVQLPDRLYLYELIEDGAEARYQVRPPPGPAPLASSRAFPVIPNSLLPLLRAPPRPPSSRMPSP